MTYSKCNFNFQVSFHAVVHPPFGKLNNRIFHSACIFDNNNPLFSSKNNPSAPLIKFLSIGKLNNLPSPIFTFPSRFISRLGARHRDLEPLSTSTPSTFAPFYPRLSRKRRCSSRAPLLGMHRALEREREREGRGEGGGGWSS